MAWLFNNSQGLQRQAQQQVSSLQQGATTTRAAAVLPRHSSPPPCWADLLLPRGRSHDAPRTRSLGIVRRVRSPRFPSRSPPSVSGGADREGRSLGGRPPVRLERRELRAACLPAAALSERAARAPAGRHADALPARVGQRTESGVCVRRDDITVALADERMIMTERRCDPDRRSLGING